MAISRQTIEAQRKKNRPYAVNGLGSKTAYKQREHYKRIYETEPNTVDFWYKDVLYGRVDDQGNAVYPSEANLKQVPGGDCVLALNFVSDAYGAFMDEFVARNMSSRAFVKEKFLSSQGITPKRAWISVSKVHHEKTKNTYNTFVEGYLRQGGRIGRVRAFEDFVNHFIDYLSLVGTQEPFTKTGLITSLFCVPNISGLCIEMSIQDYSNDPLKDEDFFGSDFYYSYRDAARNHGFLIDRNAPWRLVADIKSANMHRYMRRYGSRPGEVFDKYYYRSHLFDVASMKVYLQEFYNSFAQIKLDLSVETEYNDNYWLGVYARIRQAETLEELPAVELEHLIKEAKEIRKYRGPSAAVKYINKNFLGQLTPTV